MRELNEMMLDFLIVLLLLSQYSVLSINEVCDTNGGFNCCSKCMTKPCSMTFSSNVTFIGDRKYINTIIIILKLYHYGI